MAKASPCVMVTGVGAIIGQGIIKSLRMTNQPIRIVGLDRNPQAFGFKYCDTAYTKPHEEKGIAYADFLREVIDSEGVDLIIPGIEHDVFYFDANRSLFDGYKVHVVLNRHDLIEIARDKWKTFQALVECGIEPIPTLIPRSWQECIESLGEPPFLMKPRQGSGSRGIVTLENKRDFDYWSKKVGKDFLVQQIIGSMDDEFTVAVFGYGDGTSCAPIIMRRTLSEGGATLSAEVVVSDAVIEGALAALTEAFKPLGPTNYQFRKEGGRALLLEINPRISSSTSLRAAFGYNEAHMCIEYYLNGRLPRPAIRGGRAVRYIEDSVEFR